MRIGFSDRVDPLEDTRSLSRASSMSTSSLDMVSSKGEDTSDHEEIQVEGQVLNAKEELIHFLHGLNEYVGIFSFRFYQFYNFYLHVTAFISV